VAVEHDDTITISGPTFSGRYNVFGIEDDGFFLQGGCTIAQLEQLRTKIDEVLATVTS
jgi:hypothetical protein